MTIALRHLQKRLGAHLVLRDVSLEVEEGEVLVVLGPSGSGKTTLLRLLAGILTPDGGEVWFGDQLMNAVPAHLRQAALVFQHPALWPHLTVAENIGYGLD
ncbi:MAG TPA: sulfate ABC transporter ATP-binding protein, partial [Verrucomicrobiales bacterium]|nr:sulfate ABC transporter ATP-binding protein [Verrucomicrobiales bacterium]